MKRNRFLILSLLAAAVVGGAALWLSHDRTTARAQPPGSASATLQTVEGRIVGTATFTQLGGRVMVDVTVNGLPPGFHGFHVHAVGVCDPATNFTSAAGHLNPAGRGHADHAGDQPSLYVLADGSGALIFWTDRYAVTDLFDADGSALIVHAMPDNFANIPARYAPNGPDQMTLDTGDAGGRIACGVIGVATQKK